MRVRLLETIVIGGCLVLAGCGYRETPQERQEDANSPAGKVGQAAHKAAVEAGKAGRAIGRELDKAAHDAHEGWKEAGRKDQEPREK
ncbi:MAG: hypothetical protein ACJ74Y_00990 [Bryobacteraceae bacterium]